MTLKQIIRISLLIAPVFSACQASAPASTPHTAAHKVAPQNDAVLSGKLTETIDAGGYTYVKIILDNKPVWAAGPVTKVKQGDLIAFNPRMPMKNFHSKALNRDFEIIYFVGQFSVNGKSSTPNRNAASADPHKNTQNPAVVAEIKTFPKADNGRTIENILNDKEKLDNKAIQVRGQVIKFTADVMGKNWIHIRDKSTSQDLTITTDAAVALNDIILVNGQLALNKDFGYGYVYEVIVEDAKITKEAK